MKQPLTFETFHYGLKPTAFVLYYFYWKNPDYESSTFVLDNNMPVYTNIDLVWSKYCELCENNDLCWFEYENN